MKQHAMLTHMDLSFAWEAVRVYVVVGGGG